MFRMLIASFTLAGAVVVMAGPSFTSVWKAPNVTKLNFAGKKVAAVVMTDDQSLQMSAEEALTRELTARGVEGRASYRFVPPEEMKNADKAKPWFEKAGIEGVVAMRPVRSETEKTYSPVVWSSGYYQSFWGYYGYGWSSVYVRPGKDVRTIVVETLIFDVTKNQLVWAATSSTRDPKTLQNFIKDLVNAAVDEMKKMKFVG